ncbi:MULTISPECIES: aldolase/citrate lyase family protein [unclassified Sinorhizobium]|uniref:aldolase/citrate lyase family protein n=1 Tax=unclassified Sinorhizobium TaxID=2613772 RepID=UPI0024C44BBC|nr:MULTISPECIES: aldolase/citrate lyase family protein [unclassified Sinorhizobium]MDK1376718.1 aldolase/citrate lyase family protein [Sinorhizobium sp. 6-70]MDK1482768.1 aldolase/citrate lyase family protein [Sinorhizobium sp. 6-117]
MSVNRQQTMKPLLYLPASASFPEADILDAVQAIVFDAAGGNDVRDMASKGPARTASWLRFVRLGPVENITEADLQTVLASRINGIVLAGCRGPADVQKLDVLLRVAEAIAGSAAGSVAILAEYATTPQSVLSPHALTGVSPRLKGLIFSAALLAEPAGCALPSEEMDAAPVIVAGRAAVVLRAREAGIAAYDVLPGDANDEAAVRRYCAASTRNGFSAVVAQSSRQVALQAALFGCAS